MFILLEQAISDVFRVFLVGMLLYVIFFAVLLRLSFYRSRSFAKKNLRNLDKLGEFMDRRETGAGEMDQELLNNIIARYRKPGVKSGILRGSLG
jgi:hypothetical protein